MTAHNHIPARAVNLLSAIPASAHTAPGSTDPSVVISQHVRLGRCGPVSASLLNFSPAFRRRGAFSPLSGGVTTRMALECSLRAERDHRRSRHPSAAPGAISRVGRDSQRWAINVPPALDLSPLSARCCHWIDRPSRADGGCYPEGCRADSIAPSAATARGPQPTHAASPRHVRSSLVGLRSALDPHRRAA